MELSSFADEVLEYIFCQSSCLTYIDIINVSKTCKRFNRISKGDEIWRRQYVKWFEFQPRQSCLLHELFKETYAINRKLFLFMTILARKSYDYDGIPKKDFKEVEKIFYESSCIDAVLDVLYGIAYERVQVNLTERYYAKRLYEYALHYQLRLKWMKVLDYCGVFGSSEYKCELEEGAILISQWNNVDSKIKADDVTKELDHYAELVKQKVPIALLESTQLVDSYDRTRTILTAINEVFYKELKFHGNRAYYYDINNSFINEVLKTKSGIPISLSVVYMSIARRLNLNVEGVNFPGHFLIKVMFKTLNGDTHKYVDCFDNGRMLDENECIQTFLPNMNPPSLFNRDIFRKADKLKIFIRMTANIANILRQSTVLNTRNLDGLISCLELMLLLDPNDDESKLLLSRLYLHQGINLEEVVENLQSLSTSNRNLPSAVLDSLLSHATDRQNVKFPREVKKRSSSSNSEVEFRVGMIMKHKRYHYRCVIYGWDSECCMGESWKVRMGVYDLPGGPKQPFYNVLAADGSSRYAAQENLFDDNTSTPITHADVGKYFIRFAGNYYEANELLNEHYPEDQPLPLLNMDFPGS